MMTHKLGKTFISKNKFCYECPHLLQYRILNRNLRVDASGLLHLRNALWDNPFFEFLNGVNESKEWARVTFPTHNQSRRCLR